MKIISGEKIKNSIFNSAEEWNNLMCKAKPLMLESLEPEKTVLAVIDIVEGFTRKGALASERIAGIS